MTTKNLNKNKTNLKVISIASNLKKIPLNVIRIGFRTKLFYNFMCRRT